MHTHLPLPVCSVVVIVFSLLTAWAGKIILRDLEYLSLFALICLFPYACPAVLKGEFAGGLFVLAGSRTEAFFWQHLFPCRTNTDWEPGFNARGPAPRSVLSLDSRELGWGYLCGKDRRCRGGGVLSDHIFPYFASVWKKAKTKRRSRLSQLMQWKKWNLFLRITTPDQSTWQRVMP